MPASVSITTAVDDLPADVRQSLYHLPPVETEPAVSLVARVEITGWMVIGGEITLRGRVLGLVTIPAEPDESV
jgi:hypothetical protein